MSFTVQLSTETSPAKDGVPTAEEATEATEANAGVGEDGEEDQGTDPNQAGIYTEHVFTDPLGVGPTECFADETQRWEQSQELTHLHLRTLMRSDRLP